MKTIFWMQADGIGEEDFFFVDGKRINSQSKVAQKADNKIIDCQNNVNINKDEIIKYRTELESENFIICYIPHNGFFYQSTAVEQSKDGRKKTIIAWFSPRTINEAIITIPKMVHQCGYTFREKELKILEDYLQLIRNKRIIRMVVEAFLVIISIVGLITIKKNS